MDSRKNPKTDFEPVGKLSKAQAREEVEALREAIEYHDHLYYVKAEPQISDSAYDKLFCRLQELEEAYSDLRSDTSRNGNENLGVAWRPWRCWNE